MTELSNYKKRKIKKKLHILAEELQKLIPEAKTELYYTNNFQLLIAILMSAQATDKQVNIINRNFFNFLKKPQDGIDLWVDEIKEFINSVSFYNNKAENIYKTCKILVWLDNKIPETVEALTKLPWVGIKTAKVFLWVTKNAPYLWVDTHVHRVLNRFWIVKTKAPLETDKIISQVEMDVSYKNLHNTLVLFGRYYSKANEDDFNKSKNPEFLFQLKEKLDSVK